ncbi:MAG: ATP-binding protein [Gammaproteobacteria bacterium]
MFQTLYGRLLVVILAFGMAMTAIFAVILLGYHEAYHVEADQTVNRNLARQYADARLLLTDQPLTVDTFHLGLKKVAELNPDVDLYLLDADGRLVAGSVPMEQWARKRVNLQPVQAFLSESTPLPILGDDPRYPQQQDIFSVAPVKIQDCPARYLYVILHGKGEKGAVSQLRRTYAINESVGLLISGGLLAVLSTLLAVHSITRRLSALKADMERFGASTYPAGPVPDSPVATRGSGDEITRLTHLFDDLSAKVRTQMEALRDTDEMRRTLVANLSHDLRTPLTSLQAHLDTLAAKDGELTTTERRDYLANAGRQSRRLTRLVAQLLDLAKLDGGQIAPYREPFQSAELLQDIAQKFTLTAAARDIHIRTDCAGALPLVVGDVGLIERVLDNLIDNAIQHSPPGGVVTLRATRPGPEAIRFEVEDSGPGISGEEQLRIFDRFYRGDQSRSAGTGSSGLGLAIVKGLLELHRTTINVDSTAGSNTRFSFELPIASQEQRSPR